MTDFTWFSVNEKLPEKDGKYIVYIRGQYECSIGSFVLRTNRFYKQKLAHILFAMSQRYKGCEFDCKPYINITHWAYLPSNPKLYFEKLYFEV